MVVGLIYSSLDYVGYLATSSIFQVTWRRRQTNESKDWSNDADWGKPNYEK